MELGKSFRAERCVESGAWGVGRGASERAHQRKGSALLSSRSHFERGHRGSSTRYLDSPGRQLPRSHYYGARRLWIGATQGPTVSYITDSREYAVVSHEDEGAGQVFAAADAAAGSALR